MKMILEGGFTLQRHLHCRMARWITIVRGLEQLAEIEMSTPFFCPFAPLLFLFSFLLPVFSKQYELSLLV